MSTSRIKRVVESQPINARINYNSEVLAGTKTLTKGDASHQRFDPDGSHRDVNLPAEEGNAGGWFEILNWAGGAENLVVKDDGGATIATVSQNESCKFVCNGTAWLHMGITTIALA